MHVDSIKLLTMTVMYGAAKVTAAAINPATLVPVPRTLVGIISVAWTHITYQPTLDDSLEHKIDYTKSLFNLLLDLKSRGK